MKPENLYTPNCIRTFSGLYINPCEPDPILIDIEDIAHALSMQPRFGGHLPVFYSVAQHCVLAAEYVNEERKLAALLHDASEAYLIDVPRPVKRQLHNYKEVEDKLMAVISAKFGFQWPLHEDVKRADEIMLRDEWEGLMLQNDIWEPIEVWDQGQAKGRFLDLYHSLKGKQRPDKKGNYPLL
jgi:hypothetical protein